MRKEPRNLIQTWGLAVTMGCMAMALSVILGEPCPTYVYAFTVATVTSMEYIIQKERLEFQERVFEAIIRDNAQLPVQ